MNTVLLTQDMRDDVILYLSTCHDERLANIEEGPANYQLAEKYYSLIMPKDIIASMAAAPDSFKHYRKHVNIDGIVGDYHDVWLYGPVRLNFKHSKIWSRDAMWCGNHMKSPTVIICNGQTEEFIDRLADYARRLNTANAAYRDSMDQFKFVLNERLTTVNEMVELFPFTRDGLSMNVRRQLDHHREFKPINADVVKSITEYFAPPLVHRTMHGGPLPL